MNKIKLALLFLSVATGALAEVQKTTQLLAVDDHSHAKSTTVKPYSKKEYAFKTAGIYFSTDFEGGAFTSITPTDDQSYKIQVRAENLPINTSPWYAFKVWVNKESKIKIVKITLDYVGGDDGQHRYNPKLSTDRKNWVSLSSDQVQISKDKITASFEVPVSTKATWVAAQELFTSSDFKAWAAILSKHELVKCTVIGKSTQGLDIPQIEISEKKSGDADRKKILIVLGRQHPPEVTGTLALQSFVNEFLKDTEVARRFREKFDIVVYPLINPDGVNEGFWRHNRKGLDLNRDWGPFNQPETRAVRDAIAKLRAGQIAFAIDFHSTFDDVFYVLEDSVRARARHLVMDWIHGLSKEIPSFTYRVQPVPYSIPASTNWLNKEYGISNVVYEVGDGTDRIKVKQIAEAGAQLMAKLLLATPESDWK